MQAQQFYSNKIIENKAEIKINTIPTQQRHQRDISAPPKTPVYHT